MKKKWYRKSKAFSRAACIFALSMVLGIGALVIGIPDSAAVILSADEANQSETSEVTPSPSPSQAPDESPSPSPSQAPDESLSPSPSQAPDETPSPSPSQAPDESPSPSPSQAPDETPSPSPSQAPDVTPSPSPSEAPDESPSPASSDQDNDVPEKQTNVDAEKQNGIVVRVSTTASGTAVISKVQKTNKPTVTIGSTVTVNGVKYKVTTIGANAFKNCQKAATITLPSTVTTIKKNAFTGAKKLKTVTISNKKAVTINKGAFNGLSTKKMTVTVSKKMSKKEFNKLNKNLKKAGFKGKVKKLL